MSTRAKTLRGRGAIREWLKKYAGNIYWPDPGTLGIEEVEISHKKLPALIYIDDRGYRFEGANWPTVDEIYSTRPWNKPPLERRVGMVSELASGFSNEGSDSTTLLYAAEIALNLLRELPGGHGYEIDLLIDAIRNEGGLPDGRDIAGVPI
jgi:hypothetical protein